MMDGLTAICENFKKQNWLFHKNGQKYLTHFPSTEGLTYVASMASVSCRDHKAYLKVYRWKGNDGKGMRVIGFTHF